jgi:hypothetical protein
VLVARHRRRGGFNDGPTLAKAAEDFDMHPTIDDIVWESQALANLMLGLAANSRYAYQSTGALMRLAAGTKRFIRH